MTTVIIGILASLVMVWACFEHQELGSIKERLMYDIRTITTVLIAILLAHWVGA